MDTSAASPSLDRLARLASYLTQDPDNASLREDAWDTAMACGQLEQAEGLLAQAPASPAWDLRRAHVLIAQRRLDDARGILAGLIASHPHHPAIRHDLAYVHLLDRDPAGARGLLENARGEPACEMFQALWLRARHPSDDIAAACAWAERAFAQGELRPDAAGVASLVAMDAGRTQAARTFADAALAVDAQQHEALVTRGCLALLARDPAEATRFLRRALRCHPEDGRTLSALGFASLLARDLPAAQEQLQRATCELPDHLPTWHALGWTRMLLDDVPGALAAFHAALSCAPHAAQAHGALALACALQGDAAAAQQHASAAEKLAADEGSARLARAVLTGAVDATQVRSLVDGVLSQWSPPA